MAPLGGRRLPRGQGLSWPAGEAGGAKVFHDWDNRQGLAVEGGGVVFGDGCLHQGCTRELALSACRAGIDDVEVAFEFGAAGRDLSEEPLYTAVREATGAEGDAFVAEARLRRPSADNPPQNWQAADVETLWELPIVGSKGPTVGQAVSQALRDGDAADAGHVDAHDGEERPHRAIRPGLVRLLLLHRHALRPLESCRFTWAICPPLLLVGATGTRLGRRLLLVVLPRWPQSPCRHRHRDPQHPPNQDVARVVPTASDHGPVSGRGGDGEGDEQRRDLLGHGKRERQVGGGMAGGE